MIAMGASSDEIARHMRQLFDTGSAAGLTDGELLARFACRRAESESNPESASAEAAFETLLVRHGSTKTSAVLVLSIALLGTSAGTVVRKALAVQPLRKTNSATLQANAQQAQPRNAGRSITDPLPKYARARLGNTRFHNGDSVNQVLYTPDGKSMVAVGRSSPVRVWDSATGRIIREIGAAGINYQEIALSPDGKTLATVEDMRRLRLWDLAVGRELRRWHEGKDESYRHLAFSPDGKAVAAAVTKSDAATRKNKFFVNLWDLSSATEHRRRLEGDWISVNDLAFSADGKTLAIAGPPGQLQLWDLATGKQGKRLPPMGDQVRSVTFSPDGLRLAASMADGTVRVHDLTTSEEHILRLVREQALTPGQGQANRPSRLGPGIMACLAFSPDGSILAAGADSEVRGDYSLAMIHLWDVARRKELRRIPAHQQWVHSLCFSPDGKTLASTGVGPVIGLWDVATGQEAFPQSGHQSYVRALVVSPADGTVFTGGYDGTIRRWDPRSGQHLEIIARFTTPADALAIAPDGKTLLVGGSQGGRFVLWSIAERREIRRFPRVEERNPVRLVAFSRDGKTVASERRI
jgi:WD40 repeat protein